MPTICLQKPRLAPLDASPDRDNVASEFHDMHIQTIADSCRNTRATRLGPNILWRGTEGVGKTRVPRGTTQAPSFGKGFGDRVKRESPSVIAWAFGWCHRESNQGHKDFQSFALPTELWHHRFWDCKCRIIFWTTKINLSFFSSSLNFCIFAVV